MSKTVIQKGGEVSYTTPMGRVSYPNLFEARGNPFNDKKEYSVELLFEKGEDLKGFKKACEEAAANTFGPDKTKWPKDFTIPLHDQAEMIEKLSEKDKDFSHLTEGAYAIKCKSEYKPVIVNAQLKAVDDPTSIYGGCYGKASMNIKVYHINKRTHVTLYLTGFQFIKDGESFGGKPNAAAMFQPVMDENDDLLG